MKWYGVIVRMGGERNSIRKFERYIEVFGFNYLVGSVVYRKSYGNYSS